MRFVKKIASYLLPLLFTCNLSADSDAIYVPLASESVDSVWNLIGVNGFSDGIPSTVTASSGSFSSGLTIVTETNVGDDLKVEESNGWFSIQALKDSPVTITALQVGVKTNGNSADPREAVRTMYLKAPRDISSPNVKIDYKASLENEDFEILFNGALYNSTLSQTATWSNPALAQSGITGAGSALADRVKIVDILDFVVSNNPVDAQEFDASKYLDSTGQTATFCYYNAINGIWEVYQKGAPNEAQDFDKLELGKAYWARADRADSLGALTKDDDGAIALVLGKSSSTTGLPDPDRYLDTQGVTRLTAGWNMLSFDETKPYIRHAATGLILTSIENNDVLKIIDSSGLNALTLPAVANGADENDAIALNRAIESAKLRNVLPSETNIKFFRAEADGTFIVLCDEKFSIIQTTGGGIGVKTLFDKNPYVNGIATAVTDLSAVAATSAYGEYAMLIQVHTGADSADTLGSATGGFAKIIYSDQDGDTTDAKRGITIAGTSTLAQAETQIELMGVTVNPKATQIDTDFNGNADMLIVASENAFSLKDVTYIRAFDYTAPGADTAITIDISSSTSVAVANGDDADTVAGKIDVANSAVTNLHADDNGGKIYAAYIQDPFDIKDAASDTLSLLKESRTSSYEAALGAISNVYSLDNLARLPLNQKSFKFDAFITTNNGDILAQADDTWQVTTTGGAADTTATAEGNAVNTYGTFKAMLDNMASAINSKFKDGGIHAAAYHTYAIPSGKNDADSLPLSTDLGADFYIKGVDIDDATIIFDNAGTGNAVAANPTKMPSGDNKINIGSGDITGDLRENPAFSPNFANYGPLYTLREAGFDTKAMLQATTKLDDTSGDINWASIDITRAENEWFKNNEFNLFNIGQKSGYWAYLAPKASESIAIAAPSFQSAYTYYFDVTKNADGYYPTSNILNNGQLRVTVTGLNNSGSASVYAIISGEEVALKRNANSDDFTAKISDYALQSFAEGNIVSVAIRAVNGKGESVTQEKAVEIDYQKPTALKAVANADGVHIDLSAADATRYYVFDSYIPEMKSGRDTMLTNSYFSVDETGSFNACAASDYADEKTVRIVATDGLIDQANFSDALEITYRSMLKNVAYLMHDPSTATLKTVLGDLYDATCIKSATPMTKDAGVSIASLDPNNLFVATIAFQPITDVHFDQRPARGSLYEITNGAGAIINLQSCYEYGGKTFFIKYNGAIYTATFPGTKDAADASYLDPIDLTLVSGNTIALP